MSVVDESLKKKNEVLEKELELDELYTAVTFAQRIGSVGCDSIAGYWSPTKAVTLLSRFSIFFFFSSRRRHTRPTRDWSSDVCSSDLLGLTDAFAASEMPSGRRYDRLLAK